jgi:hypothetical protein
MKSILMILAWVPGPEFWVTISATGAFVSKIVIDEIRYRREQKALKRKDELEAAKAEHELKEREQKRLADIAEREQTRLDLAEVAKLNEEQIKAILDSVQSVDQNVLAVDAKGSNRLKTLLMSNITTRGLVKEYAKKADLAVETSNGIKTALAENGVKLIADPKPD